MSLTRRLRASAAQAPRRGFFVAFTIGFGFAVDLAFAGPGLGFGAVTGPGLGFGAVTGAGGFGAVTGAGRSSVLPVIRSITRR